MGHKTNHFHLFETLGMKLNLKKNNADKEYTGENFILI